jgi:hypothetical protein
LEEALMGHPNEIVPYKVLPAVVERINQVVASRLSLFRVPPVGLSDT